MAKVAAEQAATIAPIAQYVVSGPPKLQQYQQQQQQQPMMMPSGLGGMNSGPPAQKTGLEVSPPLTSTMAPVNGMTNYGGWNQNGYNGIQVMNPPIRQTTVPLGSNFNAIAGVLPTPPQSAISPELELAPLGVHLNRQASAPLAHKAVGRQAPIGRPSALSISSLDGLGSSSTASPILTPLVDHFGPAGQYTSSQFNASSNGLLKKSTASSSFENIPSFNDGFVEPSSLLGGLGAKQLLKPDISRIQQNQAQQQSGMFLGAFNYDQQQQQQQQHQMQQQQQLHHLNMLQQQQQHQQQFQQAQNNHLMQLSHHQQQLAQQQQQFSRGGSDLKGFGFDWEPVDNGKLSSRFSNNGTHGLNSMNYSLSDEFSGVFGENRSQFNGQNPQFQRTVNQMSPPSQSSPIPSVLGLFDKPVSYQSPLTSGRTVGNNGIFQPQQLQQHQQQQQQQQQQSFGVIGQQPLQSSQFFPQSGQGAYKHFG
ncbi:hypothetical protein BCR33DRAFT_422667 [Rhizoclosmatium globosum]|uniref:Uncharacterized protein n=1 Tax=Rhizoclosmatium globosum TaxID=329046 RepID=A0A1Y2BVR8_9FUNG|nr:hypothetical protein BCR33DRAFT_422667 [Rhizoclosmatium globosum]|eukprot:ORY38872.1 hypothetical protein BCR33DRAFT_422667 [Rhizoclosmatium globosum]